MDESPNAKTWIEAYSIYIFKKSSFTYKNRKEMGEKKMGRKYASLHIVSMQSETIIKDLTKYLDNNLQQNQYDSNVVKAFEFLKSELKEKENFEFLKKDILNLMTPKSKLIVESKNFISIYDEDFSMEAIELDGIELSKNIEEPIIAIGNFDDGIFSIILIHKGKVVTKQIIGDEADIYGIEASNLNLDLFFSVTKLKLEKSKLKYLLERNDISEVEDALSEFFRIDFNLSFDDVESNEEIFEKQMETNTYKIFKFNL